MKRQIVKSLLSVVCIGFGSVALIACSGQSDYPNAEATPNAEAEVKTETAARSIQSKEPTTAYGKYVDADGNISLPDDFVADWSHLGAWAVAKDGGVEGLHSVYAPKEDVEYFRTHQEFRDGAIMIKEVRGARGAAHTTGNAHWAEDVQVWFIMVKDTKNRYPDNPLWGDGWGWALYNGNDRTTQAATDYKQDCLGCHVPVEKTDWTYIYGYPTLGPKVAQYAPREEEAASAAVAAMTTMAQTSESELDGKQVFARCAACHSLTPGEHGLGPSLANVFGRKAGSAEGYDFSPAMRDSDIIWTAETMGSHLADIQNFIPGNKMATLFPNGIQDADERSALITYMVEASKK